MRLPRTRSRAFPRIDRRLKHGVCPKCKGNLYFEADVTESLLLRKCLQCGLIESYFWYERGSDRIVYLPPDLEEPEADSA
jgi:RNase P subunit RPR2